MLFDVFVDDTVIIIRCLNLRLIEDNLKKVDASEEKDLLWSTEEWSSILFSEYADTITPAKFYDQARWDFSFLTSWDGRFILMVYKQIRQL